jgi:alpha-glucosidase
MMDKGEFHYLAGVGAVGATERGLEVAVADERLQIEMVRHDVVRLRLSRNGVFDERPTFAVCRDFGAVPQFQLAETREEIRLTTDTLSVCVRRAPFGIGVYRCDGTTVLATHGANDGCSRAYGTLNDEFVSVRNCRHDDAVMGVGQRAGGLNRKGRRLTLWNTDILCPLATEGRADAERDPTSTSFDPYYITVPFFYHWDRASRAMGGFFIDNGYRGEFDFTQPTSYTLRFVGGQYTEYVFIGPRMPDILAAYTWLTGRMPLPPLWALGHHQCRWYPYTHDSLLELARSYRNKGISCDALWLDIDYMEGYRVFTWNSARFPAPETTVAALTQEGFRTVTIIDPGVKVEPGYPVYEEGLRSGHFCSTDDGNLYTGDVWPGRSAFPDFVREATRQWWAKHIVRHLEVGVAGIWNDMNEPATGRVSEAAMRFDRGNFPHVRYHNQYALLMAQASVAGMVAARAGQRPFVLSRSGFAGIQRYAANWLGDNCSRWEHLRMGIPMALGMGLSGQPLVGADVGGFAEDCSPELLARWYQYGSLTPFFRNHASTGTIEQYPWSFGEATEQICRESVALRYRLMPYLYTAFHRASRTGHPVQAPLVFAGQDDPVTVDIDDQYLLGAHLLVAPVCQGGVTGREVYLPPGTWHNWHSGEVLLGTGHVYAEAPATVIPLFARGGSVVPSWPTVPQTTVGFHPVLLELHLFLPEEDGNTCSWLYEDDGVSLGFSQGAYYQTEFDLSRAGRTFRLRASVSGDGYAQFRRRWFRLIVHGRVAGTVEVNGTQTLLDQAGRLELPNTGEDFAITGSIKPGQCET